MSLTSPPITELTAESAPLKLLNEWLRQWFDGTAHAVGANSPVVFPKANRAFGQSKAVQPLWNSSDGSDAEIRCVMQPRKEIQESLDTSLFSGKLVTSSVMLNFWVSAKHPGGAGAQSEQSAQRIAELLKAILTNPASRFDLCASGFRAFAPSEPQWLPSADYAKRLVSCAVQLQYAIVFDVQPNAPSVNNSLPGPAGSLAEVDLWDPILGKPVRYKSVGGILVADDDQ